LPNATLFKPREPYKRCIKETFKDFPPSSLPLIDTLLAIDPAERRTATDALRSEVSLDVFMTNLFQLTCLIVFYSCHPLMLMLCLLDQYYISFSNLDSLSFSWFLYLCWELAIFSITYEAMHFNPLN